MHSKAAVLDITVRSTRRLPELVWQQIWAPSWKPHRRLSTEGDEPPTVTKQNPEKRGLSYAHFQVSQFFSFISMTSIATNQASSLIVSFAAYCIALPANGYENGDSIQNVLQHYPLGRRRPTLLCISHHLIHFHYYYSITLLLDIHGAPSPSHSNSLFLTLRRRIICFAPRRRTRGRALRTMSRTGIHDFISCRRTLCFSAFEERRGKLHRTNVVVTSLFLHYLSHHDELDLSCSRHLRDWGEQKRGRRRGKSVDVDMDFYKHKVGVLSVCFL